MVVGPIAAVWARIGVAWLPESSLLRVQSFFGGDFGNSEYERADFFTFSWRYIPEHPLGVGLGGFADVLPLITIDNYFDKFVDVMLGIGLVFELPVLIFFLALLRVVSPSFLLNHSRYAILAIVIIAAIVTPTPDVFNLMLFAVPMCMLFFLGIFASYLLVLRRERRSFPWKAFLTWVAIAVALIAFCVLVAVVEFHFHLTWRPPFLVK